MAVFARSKQQKIRNLSNIYGLLRLGKNRHFAVIIMASSRRDRHGAGEKFDSFKIRDRPLEFYYFFLCGQGCLGGACFERDVA